jgi:glycosyltransferase involved in cell wall biosynthesis
MRHVGCVLTPVGSAPIVSVVVPCFGRREMLVDCLQSLVGQDFTNWEAIVVDDGTPSTEVKDAVMSLRDERIRYVRHPRNLRPGAARNTGFRNARADIILSVDSDDSLDPSFLRVTLSALEADITIDGVFTDFRLFGDSEQIRHLRIRPLQELLRENWIPGSGTLQRKRVWERVGGYCEDPDLAAEDWDYWIGASEQGLTLRHIAAPLYRCREHDGSTTSARWATEYLLRNLIYARHKQKFDDQGLGSRFRAAGYFASSVGYLGNARRMRGVRFATHAVMLEPGNRRYRRHLAKALLPTMVVRRLRERRRGSPQGGVLAR